MGVLPEPAVPEQQDKKCLVCGMHADEGGLCFKHRAAAKSLEESYRYWREAFGISFEEYLKKVKERPETGAWVKELIDYVLKTGDLSVLSYRKEGFP